MSLWCNVYDHCVGDNAVCHCGVMFMVIVLETKRVVCRVMFISSSTKRFGCREILMAIVLGTKRFGCRGDCVGDKAVWLSCNVYGDCVGTKRFVTVVKCIW